MFTTFFFEVRKWHKAIHLHVPLGLKIRYKDLSCRGSNVYVEYEFRSIFLC